MAGTETGESIEVSLSSGSFRIAISGKGKRTVLIAVLAVTIISSVWLTVHFFLPL